MGISFLDPPYVPVVKLLIFKRYTKDFFDDDDHMELRDEFNRLEGLVQSDLNKFKC